jgi:hypothetical protein
MDLSEPISPELVLVCPELRELAFERAREFPAPRPFAAPPTRVRAPDRAPRTSTRGRTAWRLVFAAAAVGLLAALAVAPGFTGGERPTLEPSPPRRAAAPNREATPPVTQRAGRKRPKPRTQTTATPAKQPGRHRSPLSSRIALELARKAERDVLRSPRFFLAQDGAAATLVDPATKLFRPNTTISCSVSRRRNGFWERICRVSRGRVLVRVRYIPTGRSSYRLAVP